MLIVLSLEIILIYFSPDLKRSHMVSCSWISPELYGRTMREEIHKNEK